MQIIDAQTAEIRQIILNFRIDDNDKKIQKVRDDLMAIILEMGRKIDVLEAKSKELATKCENAENEIVEMKNKYDHQDLE